MGAGLAEPEAVFRAGTPLVRNDIGVRVVVVTVDVTDNRDGRGVVPVADEVGVDVLPRRL